MVQPLNTDSLQTLFVDSNAAICGLLEIPREEVKKFIIRFNLSHKRNVSMLDTSISANKWLYCVSWNDLSLSMNLLAAILREDYSLFFID
jgi:hypothetical protein